MSGRSNGLPPTGNGTPYYTPPQTPGDSRSHSRRQSTSADQQRPTGGPLGPLSGGGSNRRSATSRTSRTSPMNGATPQDLSQAMGNMSIAARPSEGPLEHATTEEFARGLDEALRDVENVVSPGSSLRSSPSGSSRSISSNGSIYSDARSTVSEASIYHDAVDTFDNMVEAGPNGTAFGRPTEALSHIAHQMITCFLPTLLRQMGGEAMATRLDSNAVRIAISAAVVLARVGGDHRRSADLNLYTNNLARDNYNRYAQQAARNGNGFAPAAWENLSPAEQQQHINRTRQHDVRVRVLQHLSGTLSLGLTVAGAVAGERIPLLADLGRTAAANEVRNLIYAMTRDGGNSLFGSVSVRPGEPGQSARTNNRNMNLSANVYGAAQGAGSLVAGYAGAAFNQRVGVTMSGLVARGASGSSLSGAALAAHASGAAAIQASVNTMIEAFEAWFQSYHQATQTGGSQQTNWSSNSDISRLLDHSVVRLAWNSIGSLTGQATSLLGLAHIPGQPHAQQALNAVGQALAFGLSYVPINHIYQAHAGVRGERRAQRAKIADVERDGIPMTAPQRNNSTRTNGSNRTEGSGRGRGSDNSTVSSTGTFYSYPPNNDPRYPGGGNGR